MQEQRGDEKRCAVEPVGEVGAGCSHERAADDRRHRPADVLARLDERVRARELLLLDEVRRSLRRPPAGRSPSPRPATAASATICPARAAQTATRRRPRHGRGRRRSSGHWRETRSRQPGRRRARRRPPGRNSTIINALTHEPELVRSLMSTTSATVASSVPRLDPSVARNSRRKPGAVPRRLSWRQEAGHRGGGLSGSRLRPSPRRAQSFREERHGPPPCRQSSRIALGAPNPASGRTITPSRSNASNQGCASSPRSTRHEVADGRRGHLVTRFATRIRSSSARPSAFACRLRSSSPGESRLASAASCAGVVRSKARRVLPSASTSSAGPTP